MHFKRKTMHRLLAVLVGTLCVATMPSLALAQAYPSKPIKMVVPFPAGGTTDIVARILAQRMSDRGVRVVQATDAHELLQRGFAQATHVECRMCSYAQRCWKESR